MNVAQKSKESIPQAKKSTSSGIQADLDRISEEVTSYFSESEAILISTQEALHTYVDKCIEYGYAGIDTETTGLDRIHDTIVGTSLYVPGMPECYIPNKHRIPIFEELYKNQLTYEQTAVELQRLVDNGVKLILANADFDISMIFKDYGVDINNVFYYDVILAWRCLKEDEKENALKVLYAKYPLHGKGDPKKFSDFFTPTLFPYCKPEVAKLYAGNDAKITFELFLWQLPYVTKTHEKCQKHHLEKIADLIWNVEMPLVPVCASLHRVGVHLDKQIASKLHVKYNNKLKEEEAKLAELVQGLIDSKDTPYNSKRPFKIGRDFNPNSTKHVGYLLNSLLECQASSTGKEVLKGINHPVASQILKVREVTKLLSTYIDKMPNEIARDGRIHAEFKQIGADTGRFASQAPNLQNIPSHATDIRHMFRATPAKDYEVESTVDEESSEVVFVIDNGHQLYTPDGLKFVTDLKEGDAVIFDDGKEIILNVKKIEIKGTSTRICYDVI